jgi:hypothetical protein
MGRLADPFGHHWEIVKPLEGQRLTSPGDGSRLLLHRLRFPTPRRSQSVGWPNVS